MGRLFDDEGKLLDPAGLKSVRFGSVFHGGYSHSTGTYVEGVKDMGEQLKVKADEMSDRMGFECNYAILDASDRSSLGVTPADEAAYNREVADRSKAAAETPDPGVTTG